MWHYDYFRDSTRLRAHTTARIHVCLWHSRILILEAFAVKYDIVCYERNVWSASAELPAVEISRKRYRERKRKRSEVMQVVAAEGICDAVHVN